MHFKLIKKICHRRSYDVNSGISNAVVFDIFTASWLYFPIRKGFAVHVKNVKV